MRPPKPMECANQLSWTGDGQVCFPCIGPTIMGSLSLNHPMNTLLRNMLTNIKRHPRRTQGGQYAAKSLRSGRCGGQTLGTICKHSKKRKKAEGKSRPLALPTHRASRSKV